MSFRVFETTFAGRKLTVETGKMCCLSNGSCLVRYGETAVLANVTMSQNRGTALTFSRCLLTLRKKFIRWAESRAHSGEERADLPKAAYSLHA